MPAITRAGHLSLPRKAAGRIEIIERFDLRRIDNPRVHTQRAPGVPRLLARYGARSVFRPSGDSRDQATRCELHRCEAQNLSLVLSRPLSVCLSVRLPVCRGREILHNVLTYET